MHPKKIPVGISVRHVHLCKEDLETLYGPGAELHPMRELYQPGSYAAKETVGI
ncbi:MAG: phosphate propanoyltransferase, partial [Candidatus Latescibacteria bacterium]|nr:phosphate propanoyltransferase [Candidatus Latescibacterota bacterium]